jgi:hypothetical protein
MEKMRWVMVSRVYKSVAAVVAAVSIAGVASANCGSGLYCGQSHASYSQPISSWGGSSWSGHSSATQYAPSQSYTTLSAQQADATYGTGSISETYSAADTYSFSGSPATVSGLGINESLQPTNCPVNVHDNGEGRVLGCYNVVKPVPQTTYYRVVRPVVYVRYPVPVAVPYTSPCHTVTHYSRYGGFGSFGNRGGCR